VKKVRKRIDTYPNTNYINLKKGYKTQKYTQEGIYVKRLALNRMVVYEGR